MTDRSKAYIEGFLDGQATAYCEQVRLGSRLAGTINCDLEHVGRLSNLIIQEGCRAKAVPSESRRVSLWIYRYKFLDEIITHLHTISDQERTDGFGIWAMGKLFGYADCEIAACIAGKLETGTT